TERETGVHWLVGATRALGEESRIRGSVARQVRFPTLRDLFDADRGNPDLRTERVLHYEIAGETSLGERTRLELALFRSDAEDFVQGVPGGRLANTEQVRRQGLELTMRHRSGPLRVVGTYTWLDAEDRSPDAELETIQNQPEHSATLAVDYAAHGRLDLRADLRVVADRFALSRTRPTRSRALGDYAVLGLRAAWELRDGLRLVGRVENVLDEDYEESIAFPGPGRTVLVGLELGRGR
ncbi:MAG: TonB-dependent receptor, partial [Acidobacteriota bacterium]